MEVSEDHQRFIIVLYLLASLMLICGFSAQLSSVPISGLILNMAAIFIIVIINFYHLMVALTAQYDPSPLLNTKLDRRLEFAASVFQMFGSFLCFIATHFVYDGRVSLVWFGLIGSIIIFIGSLINVWIGFQIVPNEWTAAQKIQESLT